jgi:hypothetical protein
MIRCVVIALCLMVTAANAMAQEETEGPDIEQIKAETELLKAQTEQFKAEQDAEKARKQADLDQLASEKAVIDARAAAEKQARQDEIDKLKAQKELITAATPSVTGAPAGTVSFDDKAALTIENTALAYKAVDTMATEVASAITKKIPGTDTTFIILSTSDVTSLTSLSVFETQADLITKRLDDINKLKDEQGMKVPKVAGGPQSALAAMGLIGPSINALTSLISLFRVEDKYAIGNETPNLRAVYGALGGKLTGTVYFPEVVPAYLFDTPSPVQTTLDKVTKALDNLRTTYFSRLADKTTVTGGIATQEKNIAAAKKLLDEIAAINKELAALTNTASQRQRRDVLEKQTAEKTAALPDGIKDTTILAERERLAGEQKLFLEANDKYLTVLEAVLKAGDEYIASMTKTDATTTAPLLSLVAAERLRRLYKPDKQVAEKTYAIEMTVEKLSGTRKEHRSFLGTSLSFSGGVVASYRVFQASTGKLIVSGTAVAREPFTKVKEQ